MIKSSVSREILLPLISNVKVPFLSKLSIIFSASVSAKISNNFPKSCFALGPIALRCRSTFGTIGIPAFFISSNSANPV